jgi:hypothetical protein
MNAADQDARARQHFRVLSQDEQRAAIMRLAATGHGQNTIAQATGLSVEQIRAILGPPRRGAA